MWKRGNAVALALALLLPAGSLWAADNLIVLSAGPETEPKVTVGSLKVSDYWIGVECAPLPPVLRAQLKLDGQAGLAAAAVVPDSPAGKAGIQEHDVLLKADGQDLASVHDLMSAVDAAKDQKKLSVELLRAGERKKLEVQPAKRPAQALPGGRVDWSLPGNHADLDTIRKWAQQMASGQMDFGPGKGPWQFHIMRPGAILPPGTAGAKLPADTTVTITRHGDEPAKIVVQKGAERWEVTCEQLDKLPAEVRAFVEPMLHPGATWGQWSQQRHEARRPALEPQKKSAAGADLQQQMRALQQQMEKMQQTMDQMRNGKPPAKSPETPRGTRL